MRGVALALVACAPQELSDCADAACRQEFITARWAGEAASVLPLVEALEDPFERIVVITRLTEAHPGETGSLCGMMRRGAARGRCERLNLRPHLWTPAPKVRLDRAAVPLRSALADVPPDPPECPPRHETHACASGAATLAARHRDARQAAARCRSIADPRWRAECLFWAAELTARPPAAAIPGHASSGEAIPASAIPEGYARGVELCLLTGDFASDCLLHLSLNLVSDAPPADDAAAWAETASTLDTIAEVWAARDPALGGAAQGAAVVERSWSEALAVAYARADRVGGDLLERSPALAEPHVRASAAARLLAHPPASGEGPQDLESWTAALEDALTRRGAEGAPAGPAGEFSGTVDLWLEAPDREAIPYLGASRRISSSDPTVDAAICVLEAAARSDGLDDSARAALLAAGLQHADEGVRWTAARLSKALRMGRKAPTLPATTDGDAPPLELRADAPDRATGRPLTGLYGYPPLIEGSEQPIPTPEELASPPEGLE